VTHELKECVPIDSDAEDGWYSWKAFQVSLSLPLSLYVSISSRSLSLSVSFALFYRPFVFISLSRFLLSRPLSVWLTPNQCSHGPLLSEEGTTQNFLPESQHQNLVVAVLCVPCQGTCRWAGAWVLPRSSHARFARAQPAVTSSSYAVTSPPGGT